MQLGREQTLYLPEGQCHSGADIGSLQMGQRVVLLVGGAGIASPSASTDYRRLGIHFRSAGAAGRWVYALLWLPLIVPPHLHII